MASRQRLTTAAQASAATLLDTYAAEQGNICDLGNLATVCVIERSKLWTESSVFISSKGAGHDSVASVPFTSQVTHTPPIAALHSHHLTSLDMTCNPPQGTCGCDTTACMGKIIIENYRPASRALDAAAVTVEVPPTAFNEANFRSYYSVAGREHGFRRRRRQSG